MCIENIIACQGAFVFSVVGDMLYVTCISEVKFRMSVVRLLCVLNFGISFRDGKVSTSFHLLLQKYVMYFLQTYAIIS